MSKRAPDRSLSLLGALGLCALAWSGSVGAQVLAAAIRSAARSAPITDALAGVSKDLLTVSLCQGAAYALAVAVGVRMLRLDRASPVDVLALRRVPGFVLALALFAGVMLSWPLAEIGNLVAEVAPLPLERRLELARVLAPTHPLQGMVLVFALVIVSPVAEEVLFRGVLVPGLTRRYGPMVAIGVSALLFALVHGNAVAGASALVAGAILGALRLRLGSTWLCVVLHGAVNAVPVLLPARLVPIRGFNVVTEGVSHLPGALLWGGLALGLAALYALHSLEPVDE